MPRLPVIREDVDILDFRYQNRFMLHAEAIHNKTVSFFWVRREVGQKERATVRVPERPKSG